jgi:hypothetical protein
MLKSLLIAVVVLGLGLTACDPKKPAEPKAPTPKVDFTHERSMS